MGGIEKKVGTRLAGEWTTVEEMEQEISELRARLDEIDTHWTELSRLEREEGARQRILDEQDFAAKSLRYSRLAARAALVSALAAVATLLLLVLYGSPAP